MGFGTLIATIVVVACLILAMHLFVAGGCFMGEALSRAVMDYAELEGERARTKIEISDVSVSAADINATVNNTGEEKIREFSKMDVIVTYYSSQGREVRWLPYTRSVPPANDTWTVVGISPDEMNPGILDPGEALSVWIRLSSPPEGGWLVVVTPNGVGASSYFG